MLFRSEYFLYAINVRLSAVLKRGTKDKVWDELEKFKTSNSLKGFDVWSYDEICCFLNKNQSVREAYIELKTDGDYCSTISKLVDELAKSNSGGAQELPGDRTIATDGAQGQLYGIRSGQRTDAALRAAGVEYGMNKGREIGRLELAKEVLQFIAEKPPAEANTKQILDLLRQGTRTPPSVSQLIASDSSPAPGSPVSSNTLRNEIESLLRCIK